MISIILCIIVLCILLHVLLRKKHLDKFNVEKRKNMTDLKYIVVQYDNKQIISRLKKYCPDKSVPTHYPESFVKVGKQLGSLWNIPEDENYIRQGVLVTRQDGTTKEIESIKNVVTQAFGISQPAKVVKVQFKSHIEKSNGVWLHNDYVCTENRDILILVYLSDLSEDDGAKLHIYKHKNYNGERIDIERYQNKRLHKLEDKITTDAIGGEWFDGVRVFELVDAIVPKKGRIVAFDYRNDRNIHAVDALATRKDRKLCEIWLSVDHQPKIERSYVGVPFEIRSDSATHGDMFEALIKTYFTKQEYELVKSIKLPFENFSFITWGIQFKERIYLEYYIYFIDEKWLYTHWREGLDEILKCFPQCMVKTIPDEWQVDMISIEIPLNGENIHSIDVYEMEDAGSGSCVQLFSDGTFYHKNEYNFFDTPNNPSLNKCNIFQDDTDAKEFAPMLESDMFIFKDWRISLCVAKKSNDRIGLYYSGVPLRDVLMYRNIECLGKLNIASCLIDVGYDIIDGKIKTFCLYGSFLR